MKHLILCCGQEMYLPIDWPQVEILLEVIGYLRSICEGSCVLVDGRRLVVARLYASDDEHNLQGWERSHTAVWDSSNSSLP